MTGPQAVTFEAGIHVARGMRVVVCDQDAAVRGRVRTGIHEDRGFVLAGESQQWPECEAMLDSFVPELLIANLEQVPVRFLEKLTDAEFPILVGIRDKGSHPVARRGVFDTLPVPPDPQQVGNLLWRVRREIYQRKADELSNLLQRYVACAGKVESYLSCLAVEDQDQTREIALESVQYLAADGNYVRVHADGSTYTIRDTMGGISSKLDPSRFARVHRSFIVNLSYVLDVVTKESAAFARLSDGMEVPVGPNYRQEFDAVLQMRNRLSA